MIKKVGIWIRVSTDMQVQGESPQHHEERARMYAKIKGWDVVEVYSLLGVSGSTVKEHPETERMMHDIRSGKISGLVFTKLARLSRSLETLGELSEFFQEHKADLISLDEALDTSSPAGRMLYNIIGTFAQWEREETSDRVAKSVTVRAKLGKSLGGEAPFGFTWKDKKLVLDEKEAPIRKLIHELFAEHKRKRTVAKLLTERGYRTRKGGNFTDTTIDRLLKDPVAKGMRRINYTRSTGNGKAWEMKPKEDWEFVKVPRIISDELWETCNTILDEMSAGRTKVRRKSVHLFSSVLKCHCGSPMYMRSRSPKYVCQNTDCKNKIAPIDMEEIYQSQLKQFLFSENDINEYIKKEQSEIQGKIKLLDVLKSDIENLEKKIQQTFDLYHDGQIEKESFKGYHAPLVEQKSQKEKELAETQGYVDAHSVDTLSSEQVLSEAKDLNGYWPSFSIEEKKTIIETITESIIVGEKDITINLAYVPTLSNNTSIATPNQAIILPIIVQSNSESVQLCNAPMWVRCIVAHLRFTIKKPTYKDYPKQLVSLGDYLRKVRLDKDLSQPQVAEILGVTADTVTNWELNRNFPNTSNAIQLTYFVKSFSSMN